MNKTKKKLTLSRTTIRALSGERLARAVGGISGPRECHSIHIACGDPSGGALCNVSVKKHCASGPGIASCAC